MSLSITTIIDFITLAFPLAAASAITIAAVCNYESRKYEERKRKRQ